MASMVGWGGVRRAALTGVIVIFGLLGGVLMPDAAHASLGACQSDPVVVLSNGMILDLRAAIYDSVQDVQQVVYTLHAPVGTTIVGTIPTDGLLGLKETLLFVPDNAPNVYTAETLVTTGTDYAAVTVTAQGASLAGAPSGSATGWNKQSIRVVLSQ